MSIRKISERLTISFVCLFLILALVSCNQPSQLTMADRDTDGDGWSDAQELQAGTDYQNVDTDGDGYWDSKDANPLDSSVNSQEPKTTSVPAIPTPVPEPTPTPESTPTSSPIVQREYTDIPAAEIDRMINSSELTTAQREANRNTLKGKWVKWQGTIRDVQGTDSFKVDVDLNTDHFPTIIFDSKWNDKIITFQKGQIVDFEAQIDFNNLLFWWDILCINGELINVTEVSAPTPTTTPTPTPTPTPTTTPTPTPEPIPTTPEIVVTAATLYSDYMVNSVAADQKYKGKLLQVTGAVTKIDTDILGNPTVMFGMDSYNMSGVLATFKKSELNNVANISLGQTITIIGTGNGEFVWILLDDCYMKN